MNHAGKAGQAGRRMICKALVLLLAILGGGLVAVLLHSLMAAATMVLVLAWLLSILFTLYFFRDPSPIVPQKAEAIVAPAHGTVDMVGEHLENEYLGGPCQRISIFLSVFNVHVQNAPVAGRVAYLKHHPGQFLNAMKIQSAACNENVMIGLESSERTGEQIGVRLIAGLIARRIVPWVSAEDAVTRGERISLIQFGSRCDLYLPLTVEVKVKPGDKVRGGETVVALRS
jgi:phosphatidylserine decarboxylase